MIQNGENEKTRVHLRLESDGHGVLLVNANQMIHLNPTAAWMAYLFLEKTPALEAVKQITQEYDIDRSQAHRDYLNLIQQIQTFIYPEGFCPVCDLEVETTAPFSRHPTAPYRMDLALTYRCHNTCYHCYNPRARKLPELTTPQWFEVIDRLWSIGVPHIIFTGGEPTLRADLPLLIEHAEKNGQITGINTNGRMLQNIKLVEELTAAGLDHVQITLESHDPEIHDSIVGIPGAWEETVAGLKNALKAKLFVMTNTTLLEENHRTLEQTLTFLAEIGVPTIGLNALIYSGKGLEIKNGLKEQGLVQLLEKACQHTAKSNQRLIWYTPTQYCHFNPLNAGLGVKGCTAALYNMCIEPDGKVLPCQSYYTPLGDFLNNSWESIWNHELAISLRERRLIPESCQNCAYLIECGGACPLARQAGAYRSPIPYYPQFELMEN